jgi:hypothetical protein
MQVDSRTMAVWHGNKSAFRWRSMPATRVGATVVEIAYSRQLLHNLFFIVSDDDFA